MWFLRINGRIERMHEENADIFDILEQTYREHERQKIQSSVTILESRKKRELRGSMKRKLERLGLVDDNRRAKDYRPLPMSQRQILIDYYVQNVPTWLIAEEHGISSPDIAYRKIKRAKARLMNIVEQERNWIVESGIGEALGLEVDVA